MPYADKAKQRAFQLESAHRRRLEWIEANGPCAACGSSRDLEIDHIDPAQKAIPAAQLWSRCKQVREAELAKCQVLCKPCHDLKSYGNARMHGNPREYEKGCRCGECRTAHTTKNREWRQRRRLRET